MFAAALALSVLALAGQTTAATWYFLQYKTPSGDKFTSFSGEMVIPKLPRAGEYYLWPGLQPTDGTGVYQNVLDGKSGSWWLASGWCCSNPSLPWGGGFNTNAGETISFNNTLQSDNSGWTSTITRESTGHSAQGSFALAGKSFNQALFAIELTGVSWDFGQLEFKNVKITSTGTDSSWCSDSPTNYNSAAKYSISGVSASASGNVVTCTINSLILQSPA